MRIHFRPRPPAADPQPKDLTNGPLDLIRAASELRIGQAADLISASLDISRQSNLEPNQLHFIPCIHRHHLAFQGLKIIRQNSLVLDGWRVCQDQYFYQHHQEQHDSRLYFYRLCDDPLRGLSREPLPSNLDHIIYMDFKLSSWTSPEQIRILDLWLHSNSPIKLLHIDCNEIDQVGCFDLLEQIRDIRWTTNLFLDLWDRTPHFQNRESVEKIARRLDRIIKYSITAEFHSAPISNVSGLCYLYDLKNLDSAPIKYYELNRSYLSFADALRNNSIKGTMIG